MLQPFARMLAPTPWLAEHCAFCKSTDLTGFAGHNLVAKPSPIWPSVLRQPANYRSAPTCRTPSPHRGPSCGGPGSPGSHGKPPHKPHGILLVQSHVEHSSHCRQLHAAKSRHNVQQQIQGAAMRFAIKFTARASGIKPSSTSRHSLTVRSIRHPQAPLVGTLRASRSGAAYLGR
jgi:hypothetical protein